MGVVTVVGLGVVRDTTVALVSVSGIGLTSEEERLSLHGEYRGTFKDETELDSNARTKRTLACMLNRKDETVGESAMRKTIYLTGVEASEGGVVGKPK